MTKQRNKQFKKTCVYLSFELIIVLANGIVFGQKGLIGRLEVTVVPLKLFGLPPRAAVLEPHCHLPRLHPQLLGQLRLPLWLQLVLPLKTLLQHEQLYTYQIIFTCVYIYNRSLLFF